MKIKDYEFGTGVTPSDFKYTFGREPKDQEEFNEFGRMCEKALQHSTDWDIIFECVKDTWEDSQTE